VTAEVGVDVGSVRLHVRAGVATLVNDNADRHNAFDDDMDAQLLDHLAAIDADDRVRVVLWRGEGPSFSSGRDVAAIEHLPDGLSQDELFERVQTLAGRLLHLRVPIIAVLHGWVVGVSFQRALLCDLRIAATGTRFRLPEVRHGFIPDSGGVARLFQMCGHGVAGDLVLTGRTMDVDEAFGHGVVSRVVPGKQLDASAREMADAIATSPAFTVSSARRILRHLASPVVASSMREELAAQAAVAGSNDYREMRRARREQRDPVYRGT